MTDNTTMIERVARAMTDKAREIGFIHAGLDALDVEEIAKAAIEEMRKPTKEMIISGLDVVHKQENHVIGSPIGAGDIYQAMIKAALEENGCE